MISFLKNKYAMFVVLGVGIFVFSSWQSLGASVLLTHGPVVGGVSAQAAKVFVRTNQAATVRIQYGTNPDLSNALTTGAFPTVSSSDYTRIVDVSGLAASTTYYLNVLVNDAAQLSSPYPSFTTFPTSVTDFKFIVLTDFKNQKNVTETVPTFANASQEGAAFVFLGGDFDHRNPGTLSARRKMFKDLYNPASMGLNDFVNRILRKMPIVHQWDDHDIGKNNADKTYTGWSQANQVFKEYTPTYGLSSSGNGTWQKFSYAHADFFVLDNRSQRDIATDPDNQDKSMLDGNNLGSAGQLAWLKQGLLSSTARWKIIFSAVPVNPGTKPADAWGGYQTEWNALKNHITSNAVTGVILVSGDLHMGGIDNGIASGFPEMVVASPNNDTCASGTVGTWSEGTNNQLTGPCRGYGVVSVLTNPDRVVLQVKDFAGVEKVFYTAF